jgi:hypothetical protein
LNPKPPSHRPLGAALVLLLTAPPALAQTRHLTAWVDTGRDDGLVAMRLEISPREGGSDPRDEGCRRRAADCVLFGGEDEEVGCGVFFGALGARFEPTAAGGGDRVDLEIDGIDGEGMTVRLSTDATSAEQRLCLLGGATGPGVLGAVRAPGRTWVLHTPDGSDLLFVLWSEAPSPADREILRRTTGYPATARSPAGLLAAGSPPDSLIDDFVLVDR